MRLSETLPSQLSTFDVGREAGSLVMKYAAAHGTKTSFWVLSDLYFVYYLNEVCGVAPAVTGLVVGGSIFAAALADCVTGAYLASGIRTARDAGQLQLYGACGSGGALLLFAATAFVPSDQRVLIAIFALLFFRVAYAAVDIPQNAILSLVPGPSSRRTALIAYRNVAGGIARLALSSAFVPIMSGPAQGSSAIRFLIIAVILALLVILAAAVLRRATLAMPLRRRRATVSTPLSEIRPHLMRMAFASVSLTAVVQLEPYLATQAIVDRATGLTVMTAVAAGTILSQPLWRFIGQYVRQSLWPSSLAAMMIAALALSLLPLASPLASGVVGLCFGLANGGLLFTLWDEFAAAVAGEIAFGAFARFTAAAKFGQGVAIVGIGAMLQLTETSPNAAWKIAVPGAMGGALVCGAVVLFLLRTTAHREVDNDIPE